MWIETLKISGFCLTVGTVIFNHISACFKPLPCEKVKTLKLKVKIYLYWWKQLALILEKSKNHCFADSEWIGIVKISEFWLNVSTTTFNHTIACLKPLPCEKVKTLKLKVKIYLYWWKQLALILEKSKNHCFADSEWIGIVKISEFWLTVGTTTFNHTIACFKPLPCEKVKTLKLKVKVYLYWWKQLALILLESKNHFFY